MNEARNGGDLVALMKLNDGFDIVSLPPARTFFLVSHQRTIDTAAGHLFTTSTPFKKKKLKKSIFFPSLVTDVS